MNTTRLIASRLRKRLGYLAVLAEVINEHYEVTGNRTDRVRASEVAELVAKQRRLEVETHFRRDVREAARLLGYDRLTRGQNVARYLGMKRRGTT